VSGTTSFQELGHCAIFSWERITGEVAGRKARVEIWVATMTTVVGVDGDVQEENIIPVSELGQVFLNFFFEVWYPKNEDPEGRCSSIN
jgi:hypothetical protein